MDGETREVSPAGKRMPPAVAPRQLARGAKAATQLFALHNDTVKRAFLRPRVLSDAKSTRPAKSAKSMRLRRARPLSLA